MAENKKVMIGMSGGVDSSVAAYLLQQESLEVIGATMKLYNNEDIDFVSDKTCCSLDDVLDAKSVCARLGIRHYTLNMTDDFKSEVIESKETGIFLKRLSIYPRTRVMCFIRSRRSS